jgi:hypothetical protein
MKLLALSILVAIISCAALEAKGHGHGKKHGHGQKHKQEKKAK